MAKHEYQILRALEFCYCELSPQSHVKVEIALGHRGIKLEHFSDLPKWTFIQLASGDLEMIQSAQNVLESLKGGPRIYNTTIVRTTPL